MIKISTAVLVLGGGGAVYAWATFLAVSGGDIGGWGWRGLIAVTMAAGAYRAARGLRAAFVAVK